MVKTQRKHNSGLTNLAKILRKNQTKEEKKKNDILKSIEAHDLVKFGIIPELVGRIPLITALSPLDADALVRILTEPKNALTKQYAKLFRMDGVALEFEKGALEAIAALAEKRATGARGLRAITESIMTNLMYDIPSEKNLEKVVITKDVIEKGKEPKKVYKNPDAAEKSAPKQKAKARQQ